MSLILTILPNSGGGRGEKEAIRGRRPSLVCKEKRPRESHEKKIFGNAVDATY